MRALQYIYTSWKNGDSSDKGYMIYSKSIGITDEESICIKEAMQYMPPKGLSINPTVEEITNEFPYSFAYFTLPSGRVCIANTTYIGKDYSQRYGNYIIYALIFESSELKVYPVELFGESYIKTYMTNEELNATSKVPSLPMIDIKEYGSVINNDIISEFVSGREDDCAYLISAILEGIHTRKPVYINDTRENLVLWMAVVQKILPLKIAKKFFFSTYIGNHDNVRMNMNLNFFCIGVRPDANYFDYKQEKESSRHIVLDFLNNFKTNNIEISKYALNMSVYISNSSEELVKFNEFLDTTKYSEFNDNIIIAYEFYKIIEEDSIKLNNEILLEIIKFGEEFCEDSDNIVVAVKIIDYFRKNLPNIGIENLEGIFSYLFKFAGHMLSSIYGILYDIIFELVGAMTLEETLIIREFFQNCEKDMSLFVNGYFDYFTSEEAINTADLYLRGNKNQVIIQYYLIFILENYDLSTKTNFNKPLIRLTHNLISDLFKIENDIEDILIIMNKAKMNASFYIQIMDECRKLLTSEKEINTFYTKIGEQLYSLEKYQYERIEKIMLANEEYDFIATELFSKNIEISALPELEFIELYNKIISAKEVPTIKFETLINTYLYVLKKESRFEAVIKIFYQMEEKHLCSRDILTTMVSIIEDAEFKFISKVDFERLEYIDNMCKKCNVVDDIIYAMLCGKYLVSLESEDCSDKDLIKILKNMNINLGKLSKKGYKAYLESYLEPILYSLNDTVILEITLKQFYHEKYYDILCSMYIDYFKSMEKKREKTWKKNLIAACSYTVRNISEPSVASFESYLIEYLHKLKKDKVDSIENIILNQSLTSYSDKFFEKVRKKDKKKNILLGLFKRK